MSDAYISWYRSRTSQSEFLSLARTFGEVGISLTHPSVGSAILLDVDGGQVAMPTDRVAELVGFAIGALNVEWWFSSDVDLTCHFTYEPFGWEKQTYYLDGLTSPEVRRVETALFKRVLANPSDTAALIVDETGNTAEFDWDEVIRGDSSSLDAAPQALILDASIVDRLHGHSEKTTQSDIGSDLRLMTSKNWTAPDT
ncbi:hypothetical protein ACFUN8_01990 [Streptomyces sp. NPDC057307]|uniref:hypothetical protein n=1 Tax=Streptomyces sp. NPDC057307 TaxID=3346096 RepID=UPI00362558BD